MKLKLLFAGLVFSAITANAQLATINEQFENFIIANAATWPQANWSKFPNPSPSAAPWVYADNNSGSVDKFIYYYTLFSPNVAGYLITPQIVAPNGTKSLSFKGWTNKGQSGVANGTIEIGLVDSPTDMSTFTLIGTALNMTTTETTYIVTVPASTKQYIAFKMTGTGVHTAISVDEVLYDTTSVLSISDTHANKTGVIKFAVIDDNTALQFVGKVQPKNVEIYSAAGQQVAAGKVNNGQFDITTLQSGVYYILIETTEGKAIKSKFIKK